MEMEIVDANHNHAAAAIITTIAIVEMDGYGGY